MTRKRSDKMAPALSIDDLTMVAADRPGWRWFFVDDEDAVHFGIPVQGQVQPISAEALAASQGVALSWVEPIRDATADAFVSWVTAPEAPAVVQWRATGAETWAQATAHRSRDWPGLEGLVLHTARIEGLLPATEYQLYWAGQDKTDQFRTAPDRDVTVAIAGDHQTPTDLGAGSIFEAFGRVVGQAGADILLLNGDYVNDDGIVDATTGQRWFDFLTGLTQLYRRPDGAMIPMIAVLGNHEGRNAGGTSNALNGGDGIPGPITQIMSWGYDPDHETAGFRSAAVLSCGDALCVITIETDHTVPLPSQTAWLAERVAQEAPRHRHVIVLGHAPAWMGMDELEFDDVASQARTLRNVVWPILNEHGDKIRAYFAGHEHILSVTPPLRMSYDPALSGPENDLRWQVDTAQGVRQLGAGPWRGTRLDLDAVDMAERSVLDGSSKFEVAMGYHNETDSPVTHGEGLTSLTPQTWHIWIAEFRQTEFHARAVRGDGKPFYQLTDPV